MIWWVTPTKRASSPVSKRPKRRSNASIARGVRTTTPDRASWAVFDTLPAAIRHALWETPVPIDPADIARLLGEYDRADVFDMLWSAAAREVAAFARDHEARWGAVLPHLAADATLQRYGVIRPSKPRHPRLDRAGRTPGPNYPAAWPAARPPPASP